MAIENTVSIGFLSTFLDSIGVLDCRLPGVEIIFPEYTKIERYAKTSLACSLTLYIWEIPKRVHLQTVKTPMKWIVWHFIRVYTVCKGKLELIRWRAIANPHALKEIL